MSEKLAAWTQRPGVFAATALVNLSELTDVELDAPVARTSISRPCSADLDARHGGKARSPQRNHASHEHTWQLIHALHSGHDHLRRHRPKADFRFTLQTEHVRVPYRFNLQKTSLARDPGSAESAVQTTAPTRVAGPRVLVSPIDYVSTKNYP
ncbi:uncharacterized protein B0T15DRAFT_531858 [Chaetomium strumarium]|uniref:Uncharacterized protein n=1 Tax=Chaetomium strumarium TaxID=1170767 RepID=A0AAJ0GSU4_9PEZI|nr:hypothetical protein B0T15DRAFT_531858 [Chaetomium strumarium]